MARAQFGVFSKRRNSTKQPTSFSDVRTITLKEGCSQDRPTFILTGDDFNYNYCIWDNKYYFIEDVISLHNNLIEVDCVLDPLATYKSEIIGSTQFVTYSSVRGDAWLADSRIPVLKSCIVDKSIAALPFLNMNGIFILSVVGGESGGVGGCEIFAVNKSTLNALVENISSWPLADISTVTNIIQSLTPTAADLQAFGTAINDTLASIGEAFVNVGFIGNAYSQAPNCIRSCIWVPFDITYFTGSAGQIYLGKYNTGTAGFKVDPSPFSGSFAINIPWHYSDWRRGYCESVYLYLPLVGMVGLSADSITHVSALTVKFSATATDGNICYEVLAGDEIIGTYGGNASVNYPIGINQQASAGDVFTTAIHGIEHTVAEAVDAGVNVVGSGVEVVAGAAMAYYDSKNVQMSTNLTTLGGIGGGSGIGLDNTVRCFTVAHPTIINPADMQATMGLPTMKPLSLSTLTGFCQCANAHVDAPATAGELSAIDQYLNTGFYIE